MNNEGSEGDVGSATIKFKILLPPPLSVPFSRLARKTKFNEDLFRSVSFPTLAQSACLI